jgi:hypothetical protein
MIFPSQIPIDPSTLPQAITSLNETIQERTIDLSRPIQTLTSSHEESKNKSKTPTRDNSPSLMTVRPGSPSESATTIPSSQAQSEGNISCSEDLSPRVEPQDEERMVVDELTA